MGGVWAEEQHWTPKQRCKMSNHAHLITSVGVTWSAQRTGREATPTTAASSTSNQPSPQEVLKKAHRHSHNPSIHKASAHVGWAIPLPLTTCHNCTTVGCLITFDLLPGMRSRTVTSWSEAWATQVHVRLRPVTNQYTRVSYNSPNPIKVVP